MTLLRNAWGVVRDHWRAYLALNVAYYGLVLLGMAYVSTNPAMQQSLLSEAGSAFTTGPMAFVGTAYTSGQVITASAVTFVVNLLLGSLIFITLPSLIVPFSGVLMGAFRAVIWGLILAPTGPMALVMIPHSLTLLLEGQGYILALLAVFVQGRALLWPRLEGAASHWQGLKVGLLKTGQLYVLVTLSLFVAAIYEALEVILLVPLLAGP